MTGLGIIDGDTLTDKLLKIKDKEKANDISSLSGYKEAKITHVVWIMKILYTHIVGFTKDG